MLAVPRLLLPVARQGLALAACLAGLALAASPAGPLPDPTRPPTALATPADDFSPARSGSPTAAAAATATAATPAPEPLPVLQGVHLPVSGAPTAMLDGRLLKVGERIGERTIIGIDPQGVTLRGAGGTARVRLLGNHTKQPPGSIAVGPSASFQPAGAQATPDAADERPAADPVAPDQPPDARHPGNALSLAARNRP